MAARVTTNRPRFLATAALVASLMAALPLFAQGKGKAPGVVNITYVESPFNLQIMVMKEREMLEKAFGAQGVAVRWHEINSGAEQTQAMAAGSLDIATVINSTSVILANAAGNRVEIAALVSRPKETFALMTGKNGPRAVAGLRGKTIAGPKGTVLHQMLAAALAKEGMSVRDVNFIQMGLPEARAALLSGRVDAALQAASLIIRGEEAGARVLFTADGYLTPLLFTAVRPAFARREPALLRLYLDTQKEAYEWILANPQEAVAIGARYQQISREDGMKLYRWSGIAAAMNREDLDSLRADVEFLYTQGMIAARVDPAAFTRPSAYGR